MKQTGSFSIIPRGPFSLETAARHEFGPYEGKDASIMRLAFCVDGFAEHAGVVLRTCVHGVVQARVFGARDLDAVRKQIERVLSLDFDGESWCEVGKRDPVIASLQERFPSFRPVLHYSPYEAAAWSVLTGRRGQRQAALMRARIGKEFGETFELAGELMSAFPIPQRLLKLKAMRGLEPVQIERLHAIARAALEGRLDPQQLRVHGPEQARDEVRRLPGIGEFYSGLIANRAIGFADALSKDDLKSLQCARHYYKLSSQPTPQDYERIAENWRPFRSWGAVLMRRAGYEDGVVSAAPASRSSVSSTAGIIVGGVMCGDAGDVERISGKVCSCVHLVHVHGAL